MSWWAAGISALLLAPYFRRVIGWKNAWEDIEKNPRHPSTTQPANIPRDQVCPTLSVVIPVRNEAEGIGALLDDLIQQQDAEVQILVVDDHSEDDTVAVVQRWNKSRNGQVAELIHLKGEGKKAALAMGMQKATGAWIATLDGDSRLGVHWAKAVQHAAGKSPEASLLIGPVSLEPAPGLWGAVQSLDYVAMMGWAAATAQIGRPEMASGAHLIFRRGSYPALASLQPRHASGDDAFALEAVQRKHGAQHIHWLHDQAAIVRSAPATDLGSWWQQRLRWGGKSRHLQNARVKTTALVVLATACLQISLLFWLLIACGWPALGLEITSAGWAWLVVTAGKTAVDLAFSWPVARWFDLRASQNPAAWIALIFLHPWMIVLPGLAGFIQRPTWKGRRI